MTSDSKPTLAGYLLEERIGVGGMAEVFRARREGPGGFAKQLAIKRVLPDLARDPEWIAMFLEEARLAARFSCRNLVQVFDFGEEDGAYYLAMEYVDGVDLATLLADRRLPVDLTAHLGIELCEALDHLHRVRGDDGEPLVVVHRDVTPGNVLLSIDGEVKLGDFGIARARARAIRTAEDAIKGKLAYLSPEQARNDEVDPRTDIYGLGVCLFEALTGRRYLAGDNEVELLRGAEQPPIEQIAELDQPAAVRETLARALAIEPARRFPDATHFAEALRGWLEEYQPDRLRRGLGKIVAGRRLAITDPPRIPPRTPAPAPASTPGSAPALPVHPEPRAKRACRRAAPAPIRTEVRDLIAEQQSSKRTWLLVGGLIAAAGAATAYLAWPQASPSSSPIPPTAIDAGAVLVTIDAGHTDLVLLPVDATVDAPPRQSPSQPPDRPPPAIPAPEIPAIDAAIAPDVTDAAPAGEEPELIHARELLAGIDQQLQKRGLLPRDIPDLDARRRKLTAAVGRGDHPNAELTSLEREIGAFVIDRNFIDNKLQRLNKKLANKPLQRSVARKLEGHAQRALSHSVNGRYDLANRELNAIAAVVEP